MMLFLPLILVHNPLPFDSEKLETVDLRELARMNVPVLNMQSAKHTTPGTNKEKGTGLGTGPHPLQRVC